MAFQPIFDIRNGDVVGVEALARFATQPQRPPEVWFAEAAAVGLLLPVELAVIRAALRELPLVPPEHYLCINVWPETAALPALRDAFGDVVLERVVVELSERAPTLELQAIGDTLVDLRTSGLRLAIDNAGAGFASLQHIVRFSPDFIKLDTSLVHGVDSDLTRQALVSALRSFAEQIDAVLIAKGVESQAETEALRRLGVRYAQGLYLGPAESIERVARKWGWGTRRGDIDRSVAADQNVDERGADEA